MLVRITIGSMLLLLAKAIDIRQLLIESYLTVKQTSSVFVINDLNKTYSLMTIKHLSTRGNFVTAIDYNRLEALDLVKRHVVIVWLNYQHQDDHRRQFENLQLFDAKKHWLLITNDSQTLTRFNIDIYVNCDINVALIVDENLFKIYDIYNVATKKNGKLHVKEIGNFTRDLEEYPTIYEAKYWQRKDMNGIVFNASMPTSINMSIESYLETDEDVQVGSFDRFHYNMLKECRDMYNFTLEIHTVNSWGYLQSDGTIDGLVDLLNNSKIDFGGSPLFFKYERFPIIDYSVSTWILRSAFIFRKPAPEEPPLEVFVRPFSSGVWLCIAATLILVVALFKLILTCDKTYDSNWIYATMMGFSILCQQGSLHVPLSNGGKISVWIVLVYCLVLLQFYSGYILTYVLMDTPAILKNLGDLLNTKIKVGCEDTLYDRDYFRITTDPIAKELYAKKILNDSGFYKPEDGLKLVNKGGFAYHVTTSTAYPIITDTFNEESICELDEIQMYRTQIMYTNLRKRSPYKQMLDHCFRRMHENGNIKRMRHHWDANKPICIKKSDTIRPVGIEQFSCAPIVLTFGIFASLFILLLEILIKRQQYKKKKKQFPIRGRVKAIKPYVN